MYVESRAQSHAGFHVHSSGLATPVSGLSDAFPRGLVRRARRFRHIGPLGRVPGVRIITQALSPLMRTAHRLVGGLDEL